MTNTARSDEPASQRPRTRVRYSTAYLERRQTGAGECLASLTEPDRSDACNVNGCATHSQQAAISVSFKPLRVWLNLANKTRAAWAIPAVMDVYRVVIDSIIAGVLAS